MRTIGSVLASWLSLAFLASASEVVYHLGMDRQNQRWLVEVTFPVEADETVDFWLPRWQPGAYHLAEYGRFVQDFRAQGGDGQELAVERLGTCQFRVTAGHARRVKVTYVADSASRSGNDLSVLSVEANRITPDYAYVSPCSVMGFVPGLLDAPIRLSLDKPDSWQVATALPQDDSGFYHAPSYFRFEDSPLLLSPQLHTHQFRVAEVAHSVSVYSPDPEVATAVHQACENLATAAHELLPPFPFPRYHFLVGQFPQESNASGLEHSESTLVLVTDQLPARQTIRVLHNVLAHEYMHAWCAEKIKVEALYRPDYTKPLETTTIWFNEGFTEYFQRHLQLRGGLVDRKGFWKLFSSDLRQLRMSADFAQSRSWTDVSKTAAYWDANLQDLMLFSLKSYQAGPLVILALDLKMRAASGGERGIVDLIHLLDKRYVQQGKGFPEGEMMRHVNQVAGDDLTAFYDRYIAGTEFPEFSDALELLGYRVRGGLRTIREVDEVNAQQLRARADFFSPPAALTGAE